VPTEPFGSDAVVMDGAATMVRASVTLTAVLALSVTVTLKLPAPDAVGVPVIAPEELSDSAAKGAGNAPTGDQVYGGVPPPAANVCEYATLTSAFGSEVVLMFNGPLIVITNAFVAVSGGVALSLNCTVNE